MRIPGTTLALLVLVAACGRSALWQGSSGATGGADGGGGQSGAGGAGSGGTQGGPRGGVGGGNGDTAGAGGAAIPLVVDCGALPGPDNGTVAAPATTLGAVASYACSAGYTLAGRAARTCREDAAWSGTAPTCVLASCPGGKTPCQGDCVDVQTDSANCGECGSVCAAPAPSSARCVAGRCLVTLAASQVNPAGIAVDGTHVYWTNTGNPDVNFTSDGSVMMAPIGGGAATLLAAGPSPGEIALDGTNVYWTNYGTYGLDAPNGDGAVMTRRIAAGLSVALVAGGTPWAIAVDDTSVYYADFRSLAKVPKNGGAATALISEQSYPATIAAPTQIAVDPTSVYWTDTYNCLVMKAALGGGNPLVLAEGQNDPWGIAVDQTSVYWTNGGTSENSHTDGSVSSLPQAGGAPRVLAAGQANPSRIAVDREAIYWSNSGTVGDNASGAVVRLPLPGGTPTTLFSGPRGPYGIAVDQTSVYWTSATAGTVMKLTPKW
jgi:hypothetical protein